MMWCSGLPLLGRILAKLARKQQVGLVFVGAVSERIIPLRFIKH